MSATAQKVALHRAEAVAHDLVDQLRPACVRIEIAGSIRRGEPFVGDIEILAEPRFSTETTHDLFRTPCEVDLLKRTLEALEVAHVLVRHPVRKCDGERAKALWQPEAQIAVDLFIIRPPAEWGPALVIRTGPSLFSAAMVSSLRRRNLRSEGLRVLTELNDRVPCPDEETFFRLCDRPYLAPERRR